MSEERSYVVLTPLHYLAYVAMSFGAGVFLGLLIWGIR